MLVGEADAAVSAERVVVLESEIDDMNPQLFGPLMERLHAGRRARRVLCAGPDEEEPPRHARHRRRASRAARGVVGTAFRRDDDDWRAVSGGACASAWSGRCARIATPVGPIRFKIATRAGRVLNASPEFEDCAKAAAEHGLPIKDVQAIAIKGMAGRAES